MWKVYLLYLQQCKCDLNLLLRILWQKGARNDAVERRLALTRTAKLGKLSMVSYQWQRQAAGVSCLKNSQSHRWSAGVEAAWTSHKTGRPHLLGKHYKISRKYRIMTGTWIKDLKNPPFAAFVLIKCSWQELWWTWPGTNCSLDVCGNSCGRSFPHIKMKANLAACMDEMMMMMMMICSNNKNTCMCCTFQKGREGIIWCCTSWLFAVCTTSTFIFPFPIIPNDIN